MKLIKVIQSLREETDYSEALEVYKDDEYISIEPWGTNIDHLRLVILGKHGTSYGGGKFVFEIKFPEIYLEHFSV